MPHLLTQTYLQGPESLKNYLILSIVIPILISSNAFAQKPQWIPVAELLISGMGKQDAHQMSEVMHRCTALNMSLAALVLEEESERSEGFQLQALKMIQNGIIIESTLEHERTGLEPDMTVHSGNAVTLVQTMLAGYNAWLDGNYSDSGSFFDSDFETEMKGCELASKLVEQVSK